MNKDDTAHLIDTEPVLLLGCSSTEVLFLGVAGFVVTLVIGVILLAPFGVWLLAIPLGFLMALATIFFGGRRLGRAKEGKPDGYYHRVLRMALSVAGIRKTFITRKGYWRIRR